MFAKDYVDYYSSNRQYAPYLKSDALLSCLPASFRLNKLENKMIEFQERLEKLESTCSNIQLSKEGGNDKNMDKFNELLEKYGKTAEDIDFEYEDMTDDELESKFEEVFGE